MRRQLTNSREPGSRPMKTFSAIVMFGREGELLVDRDDAAPLGVVRRGEGDRLAERTRSSPAIGALRAGQDLEQRRLAGAVLAEQRVDLAGPHFEIDIVERQHAGKALADRRSSGGCGLSGIAGADESAAGALAIQERSLVRKAMREMARREWRAIEIAAVYFTSLMRSALFRFSLVIATGVSSVTCCSGFLPSCRKLDQ